MFIGRDPELRELETRWTSGKYEVGIVYGARRIGKTSLLKEFVRGKHAFYFQARQEEPVNNLEAFSRELQAFRGQSSNTVYRSFEDALHDVATCGQQERMIFVMDEVGYLCGKNRGLLSTFQYFIDHDFEKANMMVILSGSNVSFMEELLNDRNNPLYQRATFQIHLEKMSFSDARAFVQDLSVDDQLNYLSLFGAHPYYLQMINHTLSFQENILRLLYSQFGTLLDAPSKVLPIGVSPSPMYHSLLKAIARGKRFSKEIADAVGQTSSYISQYMTVLLDAQVIEKRESFIRNKKTNYYVISDPLLRFWFRFIFEKQDMIELGYGTAMFQEDQEGIADFLARSFEEVAILWLEEQNRSGKLPCLYTPIRNYVVEHSQLGRSIEIDGLAEGYGVNAHRLLVMECKYRAMPFDRQMLRHLQESVSIFRQYTQIDYYLFSKSGFSDNLLKDQDPNLHLITANMLC